MKLLLDQDVYAVTISFLRELGHDVILAAEIGCARAGDTELLKIAQEQGRILVTRDKDFGGLIFTEHLGSGVIFIRILPSKQQSTHLELQKVLTLYSEEELENTFLVVEAGRHRFRKLPYKENE